MEEALALHKKEEEIFVQLGNQGNNRYPVMNLKEGAGRDALIGLQEHRLAGPPSGADSRVTKYEHRLQETFNFSRGETAVLCVLLLHGPQTPGELRGRTERIERCRCSMG